MSGEDHDDPGGPVSAVSAVDALVAGAAPGLATPATHRRDVVLVTGPWLAGVSGVAAALRERLSQHKFVESTDLGSGDAPLAVVFVVSAATPLTDSDCALLDAAAEHTDAVVGVVSKIDVHRGWRDVLAANRDALAAHAPRYGRVRWVGAAARPDLGDPAVDDLVGAVSGLLADPDLARRNRLREWDSRLRTVAHRFDRDVEGAGRRARVEALREERAGALQQRREAKAERTITLRGQIQQARVQLSYFARNRCTSVRTELQEDAAALSRRAMPEFADRTRERLDEVVGEVSDGAESQLADVAHALDVAIDLPAPRELPTVDVPAVPLTSRRQETWLTAVLGVGFGLGVALTLSRLLTGLASRLSPALTAAGAAACLAIGLALTFVVIHIRGLLRDRALLDRWAGDATAALQSVAEELVATRVLVAESLLSKALLARDEAENQQVSGAVGIIDTELRAHAAAAARAAAARDRDMPAVLSAWNAVRAELGEPGIPAQENPTDGAGSVEPEKPAVRSDDEEPD
ncbi:MULTISPECIES: hypothetical protein [unclassified Mycobacterium]|uniref:hypothetical protein n=1 Tax=unclassified Mycobacterium TaxID=2642494 RepID=UPI00080215DC|nr:MULTISPECIES: hypothetical protein [unclassified Mycobacterium]OBG76188.1 hypothetical protein A5700_22880 [Mycobacterium sp. E1214]OBH27088.1 hypothetical protein A5693_24630 [Mycobacterium sp. E1319]